MKLIKMYLLFIFFCVVSSSSIIDPDGILTSVDKEKLTESLDKIKYHITVEITTEIYDDVFQVAVACNLC